MIALPADWLYPPPGGWTLQDVEGLPEGSRVEVIDGALIVNPAPLATHQRIARRGQLVEADPFPLQVGLTRLLAAR